MGSREDLDIDDDFSELYKEYTGPPRTNTSDTTKANKRSHAGSDEEEGTRDPNAVPTDFTSREAKVWEAKSKATERNWKKRKEEEMICKICGESGHFTQGCPSTLGANRKSQDFFERVPARDPQVKALFSEKVISKIEKEIGCKIKMEEKFIIVSGKDRLILAKGVDAVHKIKNESEKKGRSRSPEGRSPVSSRSQRSNPSPRSYNQRFSRQEKTIEREDAHKLPRGSPQGIARAYGNDGRSRSPGRPVYSSYDDDHKRGPDSTFPHTLEDLHLEYKRDAMEMTKIRDKEEDEENNRHRQAVGEMREEYMKRFGMLRAMHGKQWEEFIQQRMRQQRMPPAAASGYGGGGGYKPQDNYSEYENANPYAAMDLRARYPPPPEIENYPSSRSHEGGYGQHQRHQDYGKPYNRY